MNKDSLIQIQQNNEIGIVSFNKSSDINSAIYPLVSNFKDDLLKLTQNKEIRVILLTGFENIFSNFDPSGNFISNCDISKLRMGESIASIKIPSLALLTGEVFDHGPELAVATDIRICSETAKFKMGQLLDGNIPWDGGTQRFPKIALETL